MGMIVNNMNYDIDSFIDKSIIDNSLNDLGNGIFLSNKEIDVLNRYDIDYKSSISLKEIILRIENVIDEYDYDDINELDLVSSSLAERDYYQNSNK